MINVEIGGWDCCSVAPVARSDSPSCCKSEKLWVTPRTSAEKWTGLQAEYDLRLVRYEKARIIEREVEPLAALQPVTA